MQRRRAGLRDAGGGVQVVDTEREHGEDIAVRLVADRRARAAQLPLPPVAPVSWKSLAAVRAGRQRRRPLPAPCASEVTEAGML